MVVCEKVIDPEPISLELDRSEPEDVERFS